MGLENNNPDTPAASNYISQCCCISAEAERMNNLLNAKVSTDHVGGNLLVLAE